MTNQAKYTQSNEFSVGFMGFILENQLGDMLQEEV